MKHYIGFILTLLLINLISPLQSVAQERDHLPQVFLSSEMKEKALEFMETYHPSHVENFRHMKRTQPEAYKKEILAILRRIEQLKILREEHPQRYEMETRQMILNGKTSVLTHSYLKAKDEKKRQNIKKQLEVTVSKQFDLREKLKEFEIQSMEAKLKELKEKLKRRKKNKSEIVKLRVRQLLNNGTGLGWE